MIVDYLESFKRKSTHNQRVYDYFVQSHVTNYCDYSYVCNQLANLYKKLYKEYGAGVDSTRCCRDFDNCYTGEFSEAITCCGICNKLITNPLTGNSFWIGFNYGH